MVASFETKYRVSIKNQYNVTNTFTINVSSRNSQNFVKKKKFRPPWFETFSHPQTGKKPHI